MKIFVTSNSEITYHSNFEISSNRTYKSKLVSIILPTFNQCAFLKQAIDSILQQDYPHIELIIINDGSNDETDDVLYQFIDYPSIRIYNQSNQGLPNSLNAGLLKAEGEFVTWTSSDNLLMPGAISALVSSLQKYPEASLVYGDYEVIDVHGEGLLEDNLWRHHNRSKEMPSLVRVPRDGQLRNRMPDNFIGPFFMFRNAIVDQIGLFSRVQGIEDYDYWLRCERIGPIKHIQNDIPYYKYRVHDNTLSAKYKELKIVENVKLLMKVQDIRDGFKGSEKEVSAKLTEEICNGFRLENSWPNRVANTFKIVFLADDWGIGGMETVVINQIRYFVRMGCEVKLIISRQNQKQKFDSLDFDFELLILEEHEFELFVKSWQPAIVLAHFAFKYLPVLAKLNIPFIQVFHNSYVWLTEDELSAKIVNNLPAKMSICVSEQVAQYATLKWSVPRNKTVIVPNGIRTDTLNRLLHQSDKPEHPNFLAAATYTPHKRQKQIIEAFALARENFPDISLNLYGNITSSSYFETLQNLVLDLEIEKFVQLHDFVKDMSDVYEKHQIAISASLFEGWSLSLTEAAFLNLPIIATNTGGAQDLSKYTRLYEVENYPTSTLNVNSLNLYDFATNTPTSFTLALKEQIESAAMDYYKREGRDEIAFVSKVGLDSNYSSSKYYDLCVEVINGKCDV